MALCVRRCMCGAPNCRGTMDSQPERFKDFGKRLDVFWDGDSVFYRGTVTAYSTTTRKHTILYDDNDVERVNLEVCHCLPIISLLYNIRNCSFEQCTMLQRRGTVLPDLKYREGKLRRLYCVLSDTSLHPGCSSRCGWAADLE